MMTIWEATLLPTAGIVLLSIAALGGQELKMPSAAGTVVYKHVWIRFPKNDKDIRMETAEADLVLDVSKGRVIVKNKKKPLDVRFADIRRVTFDVSTRMRGGEYQSWPGGIIGLVVGAFVQTEIQSGVVTDYWCLIDYAGADGRVERYLLEIDKKEAADVRARMREVLPGKVTEAHFEERQREVPKQELRPILDDYVVTVKKDQLPAIPAVRPDMALVVVVCPAIDGDHAGGGSQYRLYANGTIVAVTKMGTYNYFFLEAGKYTLLSKAGNASALDIQLEAGEEYDFFQNTFSGWVSVKNTLTRQSRELVSYEVRGAYYATWQPK